MQNFLKLLLILACISLVGLYLIISPAGAAATKFNGDFETGDLSGWKIIEGDAWDFQPTFGDNPTARNRGMPSQHQGD